MVTQMQNEEILKQNQTINEKKYLHLISMLMQIILVFFSVFFSIYVYEISNDLTFVMLYTMFQVVMFKLVEVIIYKFASEKLLRVLFKLSFLFSLISILLVFTISSNSLYMVFVTQFFYALAMVFYYMPSEIATMDKNSKSQMKKFIGINSILSLFAKVLSPFLSGYIIDYVSYYVLFAICSIVALACFVLSFKIKKLCEVEQTISYKKFFKTLHSYSGVKMGYLGYSLFKFSQDGVIDVILPVLIFVKTGGNFSVGLYAALATLVAGIALIIYLFLCKNKPVAMYVATAFLAVVSLLILVFDSMLMFFIYYFVKKITYEILCNGAFESVFNIAKNTSMEPYKIEQHLTFSLYNGVFVVVAYLISLAIYNFVSSDISLPLIFAILSLIQIASTILIVKSDKLREQDGDKIVSAQNLTQNENN